MRRELLKLKKQLIEGGTQIRRRPVAPPAPEPEPIAPTAAPRRMSNGVLIGLIVAVIAVLGGTLALLPARQPEPVALVEPVVTTPPEPEPSRPPPEAVKVTPPPEAPPVVEAPLEPAVVKVEPAIKKVDPARPRPRQHTADDVKKLLAELEADANTRPPGEARSRKRALQDFREELDSGGKPEELWRQLKDYQRSAK